MVRISLYIFLTLIYIGFSKSIVPVKDNRSFLKSEKIFDSFFRSAPVSLVLIDMFEDGFFLKSYYLKLRIVHGFFPPEEIVIQTTHEYYRKNIKNLGMAIYQRKSLDLPGKLLPQPSGSIFIGDLTYGSWKLDKSGEKNWEFHHAFRQFPDFLGWGRFRPSTAFYEKLKVSDYYNQSFYGPNFEFGTEGSVSSKIFTASTSEKKEINKKILHHLIKLFTWPTKKGEAQ